MVDKFDFMAVYGSKTTLETKVPSAIRASFCNLTMDRHKVEGARDQFAAAWKAYVRANPQQAPEVDAGPDELFMLMMGAASGDDGPAPAPAGGADAATPTTSLLGPHLPIRIVWMCLQYRPIHNVCVLIHSCHTCLYSSVLVFINMYWVQLDVCLCWHHQSNHGA
jgi:hypothetical protein